MEVVAVEMELQHLEDEVNEWRLLAPSIYRAKGFCSSPPSSILFFLHHVSLSIISKYYVPAETKSNSDTFDSIVPTIVFAAYC